MGNKILVINPGGGSTKIAYYEGRKEVKKATIPHSPQELEKFPDLLSQLSYKKKKIEDKLLEWELKLEKLDCVVGRGGLFHPLESGTYLVNQKMLDDIKNGMVQGDHPSNLGALLAYEFAAPYNKPAFVVDPVSVDEFIPESRLSGLPEIERKSLSHILNMKMVAKKSAESMGKKYEDVNLIVAHLGTGISIGAYRKGRQIDVNNANDEGPFSPQRTGGLPVTQLVELCYSGKYSKKELLAKLVKRGGLLAYLGTDKIQEVEEKIKKKNSYAELVYNAMVIQIAKEIGAMAAVLSGKVDAIVITGGMAYSSNLVEKIKEKVKFITENIYVYPGENEMEALALGALRVLEKKEEPKVYE